MADFFVDSFILLATNLGKLISRIFTFQNTPSFLPFVPLS